MTRMCELARELEPGLETDLINLADCKIAFADGRAPEEYGDDTAAVVASIVDGHAAGKTGEQT